MAKLVLSMAVPHGGLLGAAPEKWLEDGNRDRKNPELWFRDRRWSFEDLAAARKSENLTRHLTLPEMQRRYAQCMAALEEMRRIWREVKPDVAIILGKDQREVFLDVTPTYAIHIGGTVENGPPQRPLHAPDRSVTHPVDVDLAHHLLAALQAEGFDIATIAKPLPNTWLGGKPIIPHAYGFIYHQIMNDAPPPSVPIMINTFYPPNQPSIGRSVAFGRALSRAIEAWDTSKRVALIASGGLTHFVCDEAADRKFLDALAADDVDALMRIPETTYQSGTSEVKLFVPLMIAMMERKCSMRLVDYVPCYRTEAGTGEGMGFMCWRP